MSLVASGQGHGVLCHEFEPRVAEDSLCKEGRCMLNLSGLNVLPLNDRLLLNVTLRHYTKAIGSSPRKFELRSRAEEDTRVHMSDHTNVRTLNINSSIQSAFSGTRIRKHETIETQLVVSSLP
ncbi:hypothetical protein TNCV_1680481 [Trichonephila clavipes]|nr:hypothetical protein TNCV_1680481 [Trichonephila clavipes]